MTNITLQSEYVMSVFGFLVTNTFLTTLVATFLLIALASFYYVQPHQNENAHVLLKGWHILVYELLRLADTITQDRTLSKRLLPLVATLFLFIFTTNLIALLPGFLGSFHITTSSGQMSVFRSPNSDLTTTLALALVTVFSIQYFSIKSKGWGGYLKRFFNFSGIIPFVLGFFEALSESMRVLSFSFRLFGNVFAGEVLLIVIAFLVPVVLPVPFMILEVFISLIQAYIFCILTLTFIRLSMASEVAVKGG
ncbi:MAG: F0F1 ATP synthase subunit A [Candidatus Kaiserbacteria bacterium]|nr:F0F1 ATP synthase subunit A [Candidatus Kaiserbacteria bacterium]MCB9816015.1 F0F1 ATP synthase subunit A [Candidatus Nomurabacteria bacterium]